MSNNRLFVSQGQEETKPESIAPKKKKTPSLRKIYSKLEPIKLKQAEDESEVRVTRVEFGRCNCFQNEGFLNFKIIDFQKHKDQYEKAPCKLRISIPVPECSKETTQLEKLNKLIERLELAWQSIGPVLTKDDAAEPPFFSFKITNIYRLAELYKRYLELEEQPLPSDPEQQKSLAKEKEFLEDEIKAFDLRLLESGQITAYIYLKKDTRLDDTLKKLKKYIPFLETCLSEAEIPPPEIRPYSDLPISIYFSGRVERLNDRAYVAVRDIDLQELMANNANDPILKDLQKSFASEDPEEKPVSIPTLTNRSS